MIIKSNESIRILMLNSSNTPVQLHYFSFILPHMSKQSKTVVPLHHENSTIFDYFCSRPYMWLLRCMERYIQRHETEKHN